MVIRFFYQKLPFLETIGYGKYDLILLVPIIFFPLALRFQYENYGIEKTGEYLIEVEKQIKMIVRNPSWEGWQNHWENLGTEKDWSILIYDIFSKWLLFILIPVGIAIFYSFVVIFRGIKSGVSPILNELISDTALITCFHKILLIVYIFSFIFTLIHFMIRKYLEYMSKKKNENKKNKDKKIKKFRQKLVVFFQKGRTGLKDVIVSVIITAIIIKLVFIIV